MAKAEEKGLFLSWIEKELWCWDSSATYYNLSRCTASAKTIKRRLVSPVVCYVYELEDKYVCFKTVKAKNKSHEQTAKCRMASVGGG